MDALNTTELLKVARDKSVEGRETLAKVVSDLFIDDSSVLKRTRTHADARYIASIGA